MLDRCTEILMRKYDSTNPLLEWVNQPQPVLVEKQVNLSQCPSFERDGKTFTLLMSSADYTDKQISKALIAYNRKHPEHMSYSFQLPATMFGIPANSWVLALPERGTQ